MATRAAARHFRCATSPAGRSSSSARAKSPTRWRRSIRNALPDKLPGMAQIPDQLKNKVNDKEVKRMIAIIQSMTKKERRHPDLLNGSRKGRVARGSGTQPQDINRLLKQYQQMEKMMSKLS